MQSRLKILILKSICIIAVFSAFLFAIGALLTLGANTALAQGDQRHMGVRGFLDEDGDGFNDLIPDFDGDGVPNPIDPDWRGQHQFADSVGGNRGMHGREDTTGVMHRGMMGPGFMYMDHHGEPGMYGPGDSTMHGGMMWPDSGGGGHHGGHGGWPPDSGGMGGGGMGPGPNKSHDPAGEEKGIRSIPENNGEAGKLAVPLRDVFEVKDKNK